MGKSQVSQVYLSFPVTFGCVPLSLQCDLSRTEPEVAVMSQPQCE